MGIYASLERAGTAARQRLVRASQNPSLAPWLVGADAVEPRRATLEGGAFWSALLAAKEPTRVLEVAADLYLAALLPGGARPLLMLAFLAQPSDSLVTRVKEAEQATDDPARDIKEGVALHDRGRFVDAIEVYDRVLAAYPGSGWARFEKAKSLLTMDRSREQEGLALCREACECDPLFDKAWLERQPVFDAAIRPAMRGGARDRPGRIRLAQGLQILELHGLAAVAWSGLVRENFGELELRRQLVTCLRTLGLERVVTSPGIPEPERWDVDRRVLPGSSREVAQARERVEKLYMAGLVAVPQVEELLAEATRANLPREIALAHNLLGAVHLRDGRLDSATTEFRQAVAAFESEARPDDPDLAAALNNLGSVLIEQELYPEAREVLGQGLSIVRYPPTKFVLLCGAALTELSLGDQTEAEILAARAEQVAGAPDAQIPPEQMRQLLRLQAELAAARGDVTGSVERLERLLKEQPPNDPLRLVTLNKLGTMYETQGDVKRAGQLLNASLDARRERLGEEHPDVATGHNNLGLLLARQGRLTEARDHLERALRIRRDRLPPGHPYLPVTLQNLAQIEEALGDYDAAIERHRQAFDLDTQLLSRLAQGRSPFERARLSAELGHRFHALVRIILDHRADRPEAQALAATCVLARKGDPAAQPAVRDSEYRAAVSAFASLGLGGPRTLTSREYRSALDTCIEAMDRARRRAAPAAPVPPARLLDLVCEALGDRALLEYVRLEPPGGPGHENDVARYAVVVLGAGVRRVLDLGPCIRIDKMVRRYRETIVLAPALVNSSEPVAEARLRITCRSLHDLLIAPVQELVADLARVVVAPDSWIHLVPLSTLIGPDDRYLVEHLELATVGTGRELLRSVESVGNGGQVCVFADPTFDLEPPHPVPVPQTVHHSPLSQYLAVARWQPLPGTKAELEAIKNTFPDGSVAEFTGNGASEWSLRRLHSPRILHIATHGFFLGDEDLPPLDQAHERAFVVSLPAILRSGLVLAGANTIARRPLSGDTDKGFVTALELATLDLRGTELVVVSGCETGLGVPIPGQGVLGLREALQEAGAEQVVASLWKVPDAESAQLLGCFYGHLARGDAPTLALRQACLEVIESRRTASGAAHPLFWGAFVASGNPRRLLGLDVSLPKEDGERVELLLEEPVRVVACAHTLQAGGLLPVITLVTRGLETLGARELALSVLRRSAPPPAVLLSLFAPALSAARAGAAPEAGTFLPAESGEQGLLGLPRFRRALVWHPQALGAVPETATAYTVLLLTGLEADLMQSAGPLRLLGRLGKATAFYPTAPWLDPDRPELIDEADFRSSILSRAEPLLLLGVRLSRIERAGQSGLSIVIARTETQQLREGLERLGQRQGLILLGTGDPEADAIFVWSEGTLSAIVPGPPRASRFAMNFLIVMRGELDAVQVAEDGAVWTMGPDTWTRFQQALTERQSFTENVGGYVARWAWLPEPKRAVSARLETIQMLNTEEEMRSALTSAEATGMIQNVERAVFRALQSQGRSGDTFALCVRVVLHESGSLRVATGCSALDADSLIDAVTAELQRETWPLLPGGDVGFEMRFQVGGPAPHA